MVRLYVGNLQEQVTDEIVEQLFQQHGLPANNIQVKGNYAFVDCPDQETADRAIDSLNKQELMGEEIRVEPSVSSRTGRRSNKVSISNVPPQANEESISSLFGNFGNIKEISKGRDDTVYVTYMSPDMAQQAVENLNGADLLGSQIRVEFNNRGRQGPGNNQRRPPTGPYRREEFPLRLAVPSDMVGAIIGREGKTIKKITHDCSARVDVLRKENSGSNEKMIVILANRPESCTDACREILKVMYQEADIQGKGEVPLKVLTHNDLCGRLIGKGGNVLKSIMEETNTKIGVSSVHEVTPMNQDRTIEVRGSLEDQVEAQTKIYSKLKTAYENDLRNFKMDPQYFYQMNMMGGGIMNPAYGMMRQPPYPVGPYSMPVNPYMDPRRQYAAPHAPIVTTVYVPTAHVGALIGKGGQFINSIKENTRASVVVESKDKAGDADYRAVVIKGNPHSCWNALYIVFQKVKQAMNSQNNQDMNYPFEPNLRVELNVPHKMVGRIIGRGGQNVRHITYISGTTITLPDNTGDQPEEVPVCIEGEVHGQMCSQMMIRQLLTQGSLQPQSNNQYGGGRGRGRGRPPMQNGQQ